MRIALAIAVTAAITIGALAVIAGNSADNSGPLAAELRIEERYGLGEPIMMVLEVKNVSDETLTLVYEDEPTFAFGVTYWEGHVGMEIWSSFTQSFSTQSSNVVIRELKAGATMVSRATWDQTWLSVGHAKPGIYTVEASHWGRCEPYDCLVRDYASVEILP